MANLGYLVSSGSLLAHKKVLSDLLLVIDVFVSNNTQYRSFITSTSCRWSRQDTEQVNYTGDQEEAGAWTTALKNMLLELQGSLSVAGEGDKQEMRRDLSFPQTTLKLFS